MGPALAGQKHSIIRSLSFSLLTLACTASALADPFPTRDENALLAGAGLPGPLPAQLPSAGRWDWTADFNWASTAIVQTSAREALIVDAETRELRMSLSHAWSRHWSLRVEVPYRHTGAGTLDGFIDGWHDFFGLPEGVRPDLPRDQLRIRYVKDGSTLIDVTRSSQALGDVSASIGYQWFADDRGSVAAWLSAEFPTGDSHDLTGNGSTDVSFALAGQRRFGGRWTAFGQVAATASGKSDLFPDQESVVWSGLAGLGVNVWRGLELKAQLDAHTASVESDLDYLGDAVILTIGGAWKFRSGWQLDLGVSEDIAVDASPDVVFVLGLRRSR